VHKLCRVGVRFTRALKYNVWVTQKRLLTEVSEDAERSAVNLIRISFESTEERLRKPS
jgi:hypothetical protein